MVNTGQFLKLINLKGTEMAKILFLSEFEEHHKIVDSEFIPRIGDTVPFFWHPYPKVSQVIWFPEYITVDNQTFNDLKFECDVIIYLSNNRISF